MTGGTFGCIGAALMMSAMGCAQTTLPAAAPGDGDRVVLVTDAGPSALRNPKPTPLPTEVTPLGPLLGTPHPIILNGVSRKFGWVVACQARRDTDGDGRIQLFEGFHGEVSGDEARNYLLTTPGPGRAIDAYLGQSPSGRFVALRSKGRVIVFDALKRRDRDLSQFGVDAGDPGQTLFLEPKLVFSSGHVVAFVRRGEKANEVILVNLESGESRVVYASGNHIWRVGFEPSGGALKVLEITTDTDGDGELHPPKIQSTLSKSGCGGAVAVYSTFRSGGDDPEAKTVALPEGFDQQAQEDEEFRWEFGRFCVADGRPAILEAPSGEVLVAVAAGSYFKAATGPVQWVRGETDARVCSAGGQRTKP